MWKAKHSASGTTFLPQSRLSYNLYESLTLTLAISNNDPVRGEDLHSMIKFYYPEIKIIYTPPVLMSLLGYFSETVQRIWKGSVTLGKLDMLTPVVVYSHSLFFIKYMICHLSDSRFAF
jgi:hypothetical protein